MPAGDAIRRDLTLAAELTDIAEELRDAAVTTGRHPSTDRIAGNRYRAASERLAELLQAIEYRASKLAPPRTPRAGMPDVGGEVLTTAAGLPADAPGYRGLLDRF